MNTLIGFSNNNEEKAKFALEADLRFNESTLLIEFGVIDKADVIVLPSSTQKWDRLQVQREDSLWQHTCFEVFLNPLGMSNYYEFNFSLKPAWNLYHFERYRYPQPPVRSQDFEFKSMVWDHFENKLKVELINKTKFKKFKVGLTAVIEEKTGEKHYCALAHKNNRADFHMLTSFILERGSQ